MEVSFFLCFGKGCANAWPFLCAHKPTAATDKPRAARIHPTPSLGMDHTAERIAQAAHIIRRIPSHEERERIMQQLEQDGDSNAEGIEAVRRAVD